ncbi:21948_t:CDS:1, partial [Gigaspora margarita]
VLKDAEDFYLEYHLVFLRHGLPVIVSGIVRTCDHPTITSPISQSRKCFETKLRILK